MGVSEILKLCSASSYLWEFPYANILFWDVFPPLPAICSSKAEERLSEKQERGKEESGAWLESSELAVEPNPRTTGLPQ